MSDKKKLLRWARLWLLLFIIGLTLSGLSAILVEPAMKFLEGIAGDGSRIGAASPELATWLTDVYHGVRNTGREYPFLFYGTDWLAFAHLAIIVIFLAPLRKPARNLPIIHAGMIVCVLAIPWALFFGPIRDVPFFWQLIDCSFGVVGLIALLLARRCTRKLIAIEGR